MTFLYGTNMELLYSLPALGASQAGSAMTCLNTNTTAPPFQLPALNNIWSPSQMTGKGLLIVSSGGFSTATNTLTTMRLSIDTAPGTTVANTVGITGVVTTGTIGTTGGWYSYNWLNCTGFSALSVSTWVCHGHISIGAASSPTAAITALQWSPASIVGGTPQTISLTIGTGYYANLCSQWQVNPTAVVCSSFMIFGLN